jgi:ribosomal protein L28
LIDDEAIVDTSPFVPVYVNPCVRDGRYREDENVDDAVVNDPDLTFWTAVDIDRDPNADVVIFSRKSHGHKISGWGHDGSKEARKELMRQLSNLLHKKGFWIEVSGRPAELLISTGCKRNEYNVVKKIFPNSKINWIGDGIYTRTLPDGEITEEEYLVGYPEI